MNLRVNLSQIYRPAGLRILNFSLSLLTPRAKSAQLTIARKVRAPTTAISPFRSVLIRVFRERLMLKIAAAKIWPTVKILAVATKSVSFPVLLPIACSEIENDGKVNIE